MLFASQKYDRFKFNCYGKDGYKRELKKSKDLRKNKIVEFSIYFKYFKVLELNHKQIND